MGMLGAVDVRLMTDLQAETFFDRRSAAVAAGGPPRRTPPALAEQVARLDALEIKTSSDLGVRALRPRSLSVSSVTARGPPRRALRRGRGGLEPRRRRVLAERGARGRRRAPPQPAPRRPRFAGRRGDLHRDPAPGHHALEASLEATASTSTAAPSWPSHRVPGGPARQRRAAERIGEASCTSARSSNRRRRPGGGPQVSPAVLTDLTAAELDSPNSPIEQGDVIVLANAPSVSAAVAERLQDRVAAGAGLVISRGSARRPRAMVGHLWNEDGTGRSPAGLTASSLGAQELYHRVLSFEEDHTRSLPATSWRAPTEVLSTTSSRRASNECALARDPRRPGGQLPSSTLGDGRVVLFTSTLDNAWNRIRLGEGSSFVLDSSST